MTEIEDTLDYHYRWAVDLMASLAVTTIVKRAVSLATLCMAVIASLELAFGYAADAGIPLILQWMSMIFAYAAAVWWWFGRWPTLNRAFAFVMGADVCMVISIVVADIPPAIMLGKTALLIEIGMFVGFFFERWMIAAHVALCSLATTAIAVYLVLTDEVSALMAFVVWSPIVVGIVGFVLLLNFCARSIRREFE